MTPTRSSSRTSSRPDGRTCLTWGLNSWYVVGAGASGDDVEVLHSLLFVGRGDDDDPSAAWFRSSKRTRVE